MTNQPWECTRCHKINAPWLPSCFCPPKEKSDIEKVRDIIGEKWLLMFTDKKGEVIQGLISHYDRLPEVIKNVLAADGRNIVLEDRTPWRIEQEVSNKNTEHVKQHGYNQMWTAHCPICHEMLNGLTSHKCNISSKE